MFQITPLQVNELRKKTGSGIMDCKKALLEAKGDFDKATILLRKKGQKILISRSNNQVNEGVVIAKVNSDKTKGIVLGLNSETDFVARNNNFIQLAHNLAQLALNYKDKEEFLEAFFEESVTIKEKLIEQTGIIGEKICLGAFEILKAPFVAYYIHNGNKIATLVGLSNSYDKEVDKIGKDLAMQVAAMNPMALNEKELAVEIIEKEKEIILEQLHKDNKPKNMIDHIVQGKLKKFFSEHVLIQQSFIKDEKISVLEYLKNFDSNIQITAYKRIAI